MVLIKGSEVSLRPLEYGDLEYVYRMGAQKTYGFNRGMNEL